LDANSVPYIASRTRLNSYPQDLRIVTIEGVDYAFIFQPANRIFQIIRLNAPRQTEIIYTLDLTTLPLPFSNFAGALGAQTASDVFSRFSQGLAIKLRHY